MVRIVQKTKWMCCVNVRYLNYDLIARYYSLLSDFYLKL